MREYGVIPTSFWSDPAYSSLSADARLMMVYLISCSHTTMLGCFRLPEEYIAADLNGFDKKRIQKTLHELISADLISVDFSYNWILIHAFLDWNPISNPNQAKCITKIFEKISPSISIYEKLVEIILFHSERLSEGFKNRLNLLMEGFRNRSETVSKGFRNQNQKQEQKQKQDQNQKQKQDQNQKQNIICAEVSKCEGPSEPLIEIILNTDALFQITNKHCEQWKELYPSVDVMQELRNICGWSLANPTRRKTQAGILKHINAWLSRAQNNSRKHSPHPPPNHNQNYYQTRFAQNSNSLFERNKSAAEQWLWESEEREKHQRNESGRGGESGENNGNEGNDEHGEINGKNKNNDINKNNKINEKNQVNKKNSMVEDRIIGGEIINGI